jgi:hypothetical protein
MWFGKKRKDIAESERAKRKVLGHHPAEGGPLNVWNYRNVWNGAKQLNALNDWNLWNDWNRPAVLN